MSFIKRFSTALGNRILASKAPFGSIHANPSESYYVLLALYAPGACKQLFDQSPFAPTQSVRDVRIGDGARLGRIRQGCGPGERKLVETADFEAIKLEHIAEAGALLLDWSRFGEFADGFRNRMGERHGRFGVEKELGRLAQLPDDDFLHPDLRALVEEAIEENMVATATDMAGRVVRRRKHRADDDGLMNVVEVEELLGANRASIKAWGEGGLVKIHMASGAKRSVMSLERAEVEAIKAERDGAITREETAALLGLPEAEVAKLAVAGVFRKIEGVAGALLRIENYPRDEIDAFWAADPNAKGDWLMSSVKANRALFERIAIGKARRGETAGEGCVRIEKKDVVFSMPNYS